MDTENTVMLDRVLRVNYFDKWPELLNHFDVVRAYPKVGAHNEVLKKRFTKIFVLQRDSKFSQYLDSLAIDSSQRHSLQDRKQKLKQIFWLLCGQSVVTLTESQQQNF